MRRLLVVVLLALLAPSPDAQAAKTLVRADADVRIQGRSVPKSFTGFSQEYHLVPQDVGYPGLEMNAAVAGLYRNLSRSGGGAPVLRIGGGSQDSAWWNPDAAPRPPDINFDITWEYLATVKRFLDATGAKLILGLNLASNRPSVPAAVAEAAQQVFDRDQLIAMELGNNPDAYARRTAYVGPDGKKVFSRPRGYGLRRYMREFDRHLDVLRRQRPKPKLAGPGACCQPWLRRVERIVRRFGRRLSLVTYHSYALAACDKKRWQRGYPDIGMLLAQGTVHQAALSLMEQARAARKAGLGMRLSETNSRACAGAEGVSDRFASALWGADWLFHLAAVGVSGANFHSSAPLVQPFATRYRDGRYVAAAKPLYYGMLLFADATPHRSRFLPSTYFGVRVRRGNNIKIWGMVDKVDKVVRVAVIHKGGRNGAAQIRIPFAASKAKLVRLRAPSVRSSSGVTYGGQSVAQASTDGALVGTARSETVRRRKRSRFRFHLPRFSAALLTVRVRRVYPNRYVR